ncbi:hypothetical protein SOVF_178680 [Spinacia oleracea]|nr:hypothetical protein SOVF_178680 [Spinacia oleracea]
MGFARSFGWINRNGCKKQCRSLFWKVRAAVKKSIMSNHQKSKKKHVTFHYDPSSYALNFDEGGSGGENNNSSIDAGLRNRGGEGGERIIIGEENAVGYYYKFQFFFLLAANSTLVYVFLIKL